MLTLAEVYNNFVITHWGKNFADSIKKSTQKVI